MANNYGKKVDLFDLGHCSLDYCDEDRDDECTENCAKCHHLVLPDLPFEMYEGSRDSKRRFNFLHNDVWVGHAEFVENYQGFDPDNDSVLWELVKYTDGVHPSRHKEVRINREEYIYELIPDLVYGFLEIFQEER